MMERKRIVVVGGGPGGYIAAIRAAQLGAEVTLVEREKVGGTCLHEGCIPTKTLLQTAHAYFSPACSGAFGVKLTAELDMGAAQDNRERVIKRLENGVAGLLKANGVSVVQGCAEFLEDGGLQVNAASGTVRLSWDSVILATGSATVMPGIPGADHACCITSREALLLRELPKSLVIVGGGVIGVEMASIYASLGVRVDIVEMCPQILPMFDAEFAALAQSGLEALGVKFFLGSKVSRIEARQDGGMVTVVDPDGAESDLSAENVLLSVGRKPDCTGLHPERAGIRCERGTIAVDDRMETNVKGIFAVGDCNGRILLAHAASAQGEVAAENAMGGRAVFCGEAVPSCVYSEPELSMVGITEATAKARRIPYVASTVVLESNARCMTMRQSGRIKLIAGAVDGDILGVQIAGPFATELIATPELAIKGELTVDEIISCIAAHPSVGEAIREAALQIRNRPLQSVLKRS